MNIFESDAENKCHCKWLKIEGDSRFFFDICNHPTIKHPAFFGQYPFNECFFEKCPLYDNPEKQRYHFIKTILITNPKTNNNLKLEIKIENSEKLTDEDIKTINVFIKKAGWDESDCFCTFI